MLDLLPAALELTSLRQAQPALRLLCVGEAGFATHLLLPF
jgi:hypothetical protein